MLKMAFLQGKKERDSTRTSSSSNIEKGNGRKEGREEEKKRREREKTFCFLCYRSTVVGRREREE